MIEQHFSDVLAKIHRVLSATLINWAVTGSLGLALQGIDVQLHDIDIQTDKAGAYDIENNFRQYVVNSVRFSSTERIRSHFGKLNIDGIKVEIMGDIQKCLPDGTWEDVVDLSSERHFVDYGGIAVPVLFLEYECEAYEKLGRIERAKQVREYLRLEGRLPRQA